MSRGDEDSGHEDRVGMKLWSPARQWHLGRLWIIFVMTCVLIWILLWDLCINVEYHFLFTTTTCTTLEQGSITLGVHNQELKLEKTISIRRFQK
jgi:hypothetical protein